MAEGPRQAPDSIAPTERCALRILRSIRTGVLLSSASAAGRDQAVIERAGEAVVLRFGMEARHFGRHRRLMKYPRKVQTARFPVVDAGLHVEQVGAANHLVELRKPSSAMIARNSSATKKK